MSFLLSAGSNACGQLSNGSIDDSHHFQRCSFDGYPPGTLPTHTRRVVQIATGANHTAALLGMSDGQKEPGLELWGCGDGSAGQLGAAYREKVDSGESPTIFRPMDLPLAQEGLEGYRPKLVSACWETTYVVLENDGKDDMLISMGADDFGDLGVGGPNKGKGRADKPFHIINLRPVISNQSSKSRATKMIIHSLIAGQHHVVVRIAYGEGKSHIVGWGAARHGQLGDRLSKGGRPAACLAAPTVINIDDTDDDSVVSIALGSQHTVFLHSSGRVTPLGSNRKGQLEGLQNVKGAFKLGCTWNGTYILVRLDDGDISILATGSHAHGQLGRKPDDSSSMSLLAQVESAWPPQIETIACGSEHVLVLISTELDRVSEVWGWGWNEHGNLGTGQTVDVPSPRKIWPVELASGARKVAGIWAGCGTSWIYIAEE